MIRLVAKRRVGVLAYAAGEREYARRVLRSLGYAPLIFTNLDELTAMGADAMTLDMLYVGNLPVTDSKGREVLEGVRVSIGPDVPVLHAGHQEVRPKVRGVAASLPRSFSDFYKLIRSFMSARGFESNRSHLAWGVYAFDPLDRGVSFADHNVQLDAAAFDIALELFFNAERTLSHKRLKQMLYLDKPVFRNSDDYLTHTITGLATDLRLCGTYGWSLETLGPAGYRLSRVEARTSDLGAETVPHPVDQLERQ